MFRMCKGINAGDILVRCTWLLGFYYSKFVMSAFIGKENGLVLAGQLFKVNTKFRFLQKASNRRK